MAPRLKDIAQRTGLDVSTVSRVLNNDTSRGVSEAKRQEVLAAARTMGYRPHRSARSLRTGRHYNVAYVLAESPTVRSDLELPFARQRLYGIEEALAARGYLLSLLRIDPTDPKSVQERVLRHGQVDGLVFNFTYPSPPVIEALQAASLPVIVIDADIFDQSGGAVSCIRSDREAGIYQSVSHLISLGHRRIALINAAVNRRRLAGYQRALREHGIEVDPRLIRSWDGPERTLPTGRMRGAHAARELLAGRVEFTAIQAGSDLTATGAVDALWEAGLRVPEDIAVAGFDNVDALGYSPFPEPFLTTVDDPNREMGRKAAELLLTQIETDAKPQQIILPTQLLIRASSGGPIHGAGAGPSSA